MSDGAADLAIGVIISGAFGKAVTFEVNDIPMPPIGSTRFKFGSLACELVGDKTLHFS